MNAGINVSLKPRERICNTYLTRSPVKRRKGTESPSPRDIILLWIYRRQPAVKFMHRFTRFSSDGCFKDQTSFLCPQGNSRNSMPIIQAPSTICKSMSVTHTARVRWRKRKYKIYRVLFLTWGSPFLHEITPQCAPPTIHFDFHTCLHTIGYPRMLQQILRDEGAWMDFQ